jgi:hypothetical protein
LHRAWPAGQSARELQQIIDEELAPEEAPAAELSTMGAGCKRKIDELNAAGLEAGARASRAERPASAK